MSVVRFEIGLVAIVFAFGAMAPVWGQRADRPYPPRSASDRDSAVRSTVVRSDRPGDGPVRASGCPGGGDCCVANGTPGCSDAACCQDVCFLDSFCCDVEWDSSCADLAATACDPSVCGGVCPGSGDCCEPNGTPGCNNAACCDAVCSADPFCCDTLWDTSCAGMAETLCSGCGGPSTGACCDPSTGVCEDGVAQLGCESAGGVWSAGQSCLDVPCGGVCPGEGDCCLSNGTPGCNDEACCDAVCGADPFCCDTNWDTVCAGQAVTLCGGLCGACCDPATEVCADGSQQLACESTGGVWSGGLDCIDVVCVATVCPGVGSCCVNNGTPGCEDAACCELVCGLDPFCCDVAWDANCAGEANQLCAPALCGEPGCPGVGDCCDVAGNGTPGCGDAACCDAVCGVDPFCCEVSWDSVCADDAFGLCGCPLCPDTPVIWVEPADGFIDARQPHLLNDPMLLLGVTQVVVEAPAASGDAACWTLCESNQNPGLHAGLGPNSIASVTYNSGSGFITLHLGHALTPGEVTKIAYVSASGATVHVARFIAHPADVDGDGTAAPSDILAVIDALNMVVPLPIERTDLDRSGVAGPADILTVIDLLNGASAFEPWVNARVVDDLICP